MYPIGKDWLGSAAGDGAGLLEATRVPPAATFVITTQSIDRDGDLVVSRGGRFDRWARAGAPVFWDHQQGPHGLPIGTCLDPDTGALAVRVEEGRVLAKVWFDESDFAQEVGRLVRRGLIKGASIGFMPLQLERLSERDKTQAGGDYPAVGHKVSAWEMLELSIVGVGSNSEALRQELSLGYSDMVRKALRACVEEPALDAEAVLAAIAETRDALRRNERDLFRLTGRQSCSTS